jgi:hypothetical protein
MALILTQVYLESKQKKDLAAKAKATGRKSSDLVREAVDALLSGVNPEDLRQLDLASQRAEVDIQSMLESLSANANSHAAFVAEMEKLRAAVPR